MDFRTFLTAELPGLAAYARVLTGSREAAHDLVAHTLVAAQEKWPRIAGTSSPAAYVHRMVTNAFVSEKRRWSTSHIVLTPRGILPEQAGPDFRTAVDSRDELHHLLEDLPRQQLCAVVLRYYLGASDADIADELGCSQGAARAYISRGLKTLRVRLEETAPTEQHGLSGLGVRREES